MSLDKLRELMLERQKKESSEAMKRSSSLSSSLSRDSSHGSLVDSSFSFPETEASSLESKSSYVPPKKKKRSSQARSNRSSRSSSRKSRSSRGNNFIEAQLGEFTLQIPLDYFPTLIKKIWELDSMDLSLSEEIDSDLVSLFRSHSDEFDLPLDFSLFESSIRNDVYFQVSEDLRLDYYEFKRTWPRYVGSNKPLLLSGQRKEFIQFFTNKFRSRWVDEKGKPLPLGKFQLLTRLEREPRAIQSIFEFIKKNWISSTNSSELNMFIKKFRVFFSKSIKDFLLGLSDFSSHSVIRENQAN